MNAYVALHLLDVQLRLKGCKINDIVGLTIFTKHILELKQIADSLISPEIEN